MCCGRHLQKWRQEGWKGGTFPQCFPTAASGLQVGRWSSVLRNNTFSHQSCGGSLLASYPAHNPSPVGFVALAASNYRLYQSDISPRTSAGRGVEPYRTTDSVVASTSGGQEAKREGAETSQPASVPLHSLPLPLFLARRTWSIFYLFFLHFVSCAALGRRLIATEVNSRRCLISLRGGVQRKLVRTCDVNLPHSWQLTFDKLPFTRPPTPPSTVMTFYGHKQTTKMACPAFTGWRPASGNGRDK